MSHFLRHGCADNWSVKAIGRKTTGTGRLRHLKDMPRRFKNGFREGALNFNSDETYNLCDTHTAVTVMVGTSTILGKWVFERCGAGFIYEMWLGSLFAPFLPHYLQNNFIRIYRRFYLRAPFQTAVNRELTAENGLLPLLPLDPTGPLVGGVRA